MTIPLDADAIRLNEHSQRRQLNREAHLRPSLQIAVGARVSYLAYLHRHLSREQENWLYRELAIQLDIPCPPQDDGQFLLETSIGRIKWERHGEFSSLAIMAREGESRPFAKPALLALPATWLELLPGNVLVAAHAVLLGPGALPLRVEDIAAQYFSGHELVGAEIGDGAGRAYTDFHIHADGFSRYVLADFYMGRRQAARMLFRLLELETYRMLALLALPVAKTIAPELAKVDEELAELTGAMSMACGENEPQLLHRLTELAGATENALSRTDHRFTASQAYYEIARNRIVELREKRIQGLQPFQQFMERRLAPAMDTCRAVAARQRELAERVNRATALLRTRVDIRRERQNQALLSSMERRAAMQLRLQQTVEGLSIAAITYYAAGLAGYLFKGAKAAGLPLNVEITTAAMVPVLALAIALGLGRMRAMLHRQDEIGRSH
ncbi:DUF3422 family protein [Chromobacterium sphagni]|uniref:Egg lysin n=1 Tax=Chromobacterium sphagni TaxID=1903179 RepID=A0ABX3C8S8_9NEIS|nr:DUF3422 domain-containing protein [Chromobacterium sphagni]OHX17521.1 hypothetical protein BI344_20765 [Chromobacterium sphagni]